MQPYLNFTSLNKLFHCIVNIYACVLYVCIVCSYAIHVVWPEQYLSIKFCSVLFNKDFSETSTKSKCLRKYRLKRFVQVRGSFGKYIT